MTIDENDNEIPDPSIDPAHVTQEHGEIPSAAPTPGLLGDPTVVLAAPLALVTVLVTSTPGWVPIAAWLCVAGWLALGGVWVFTRIRAARPSTGSPWVRPFWMVVVLPGFLAIVLVAVAADLPLRARFALSRDDLAGAAANVLEAKPSAPPTRVGTFPVQSIETDGRTVWFVTEGLGTTDRWGIVYSPESVPEHAGTAVKELDEGWFAFHEGPAAFPML